ncbi:MAG: hypothetical protein VKK05_03070 [Synechococcus sp.]|nr:hypothetical protein [Synechococcus sp.]
MVVIALLVGAMIYLSADRTLPCFARGEFHLEPGQHAPFCGITKIHYAFPPSVIDAVMYIASNPAMGKRISVPGIKASRAITAHDVRTHVPELLSEYNTLAQEVSRIVGTTVKTVPLSEPLSVCIIIYEQIGDHITWHYDDNPFKGRFFTLLAPITHTQTCTHFEFKDHRNTPVPVLLSNKEGLLFEGNKIYHRASRLCANEKRIMASFQFATNTETTVNIMNTIAKHIKTRSFTG